MKGVKNMGEIDEILKKIKKSNQQKQSQDIIREPQSDYYSKNNKKPINLGDGIPVNEGANLDNDDNNNSKDSK